MKSSHLVATLFGILASALGSAAVAQSGDLPRLIGPTASPGVMHKSNSTRAVVQSRAVQPDVALVEHLARAHVERSEKRRFVVDLFPGLELEAEVVAAETRPSGSTVFARLTEIELGSAVLTYEAGELVGTIDFPGGSYTLTRQAQGSYVVAKQAPQLFAPEREPREVVGPALSTADAIDGAADVPTDSGRLIDVMVLWTANAQSAAGGLAGIQSLAQASIDNANLTYLNSGVAQRLRLVHAQQIAYTEQHTGCPINGADTEFERALDHVTGTSDGEMDTVHSLRTTHGADLVSLLIDGVCYCGIAWLPQPPSAGTSGLGFSVIDHSCAVGNKSFVHELGHNMGAHHDPYVARGAGAYDYSHGIVNVAQRWRDVMAYNNECTATPPGTSCNRIPYMSNPKLTYGGAALGDASTRNNSHTLNKTAKAIAAYRATSGLHSVAQRFTDVATNHAFYGHIEFFAQAGVSTGCAAGQFCPDNAVTRRQMAVFLERGIKASNWTPPAPTGLFADVLPGSQFHDFIEALYNDSVTTGCTGSPLRYCPEQTVSRAQMAVFVLRARCGSSYVPSMPLIQRYADVLPTHQFYRYIDKMAAFNITLGCAPNLYCPDQPVSRGQMAAFFERAYPFLAPTESCPL